MEDDDDDAGPRGAAVRDSEPGESAEPPLLPDGVDLSQFDDEDEDIAAAAAAASRGAGGGGGESSDDDSSDNDDDEDAELARELDLIRREREEAKLRAAQAEAAEAEAAAAASLARNPLMPMAGAQAGPTFGNDTPFGAGGVKRRWDDDVVVRQHASILHTPSAGANFVSHWRWACWFTLDLLVAVAALFALCLRLQFKNQAKGDLVNKQKKRFINDSIRSDFHRSFMNRYVQ